MTSGEIDIKASRVPGWIVKDDNLLFREFRFKNFREGLDFVNRIGAIAEKEGHHPDILLSWGKVTVTLMTHTIHGLSENDFIMAAKISELYDSPGRGAAQGH